jgi:hypothetical protein
VKRQETIERALKMHLWDPPYFIPKSIIPPGSVVRVRVDPTTDASLRRGEAFRIGYYSRQDGPNCVWLVDAAGTYTQTWDQASLGDTFDVVELSMEADIYGLHRPPLGAIA